jgi:hypothetical protein
MNTVTMQNEAPRGRLAALKAGLRAALRALRGHPKR